MNLKYPKLEPFNFLGLEKQDYLKSKVVIFPVPYSSTTYWKSGTKEGPQAIIETSRHLELYDQEFKKDFSLLGIFTLGLLEPSKNSPQETIERIKKVVSLLLEDKKFVVTLGGEHSIALGAIKAFAKKFKDFSVLQLDAHADLRDEFEGTKYHHACTMRRIRDLGLPIHQVGIRSLSEEEDRYIKKAKIKNIFFAPSLPIKKIMASLKSNVYLTLDLDVLDPSIMPSVGTAEPGGLNWHEILSLIKEVAKKRKIIGADVVELCPIPNLAAPDFLAAKLIYKLLSYKFSNL